MESTRRLHGPPEQSHHFRRQANKLLLISWRSYKQTGSLHGPEARVGADVQLAVGLGGILRLGTEQRAEDRGQEPERDRHDRGVVEREQRRALNQMARG